LTDFSKYMSSLYVLEVVVCFQCFFFVIWPLLSVLGITKLNSIYWPQIGDFKADVISKSSTIADVKLFMLPITKVFCRTNGKSRRNIDAYYERSLNLILCIHLSFYLQIVSKMGLRFACSHHPCSLIPFLCPSPPGPHCIAATSPELGGSIRHQGTPHAVI
jgi:hypothetical protein